MLAYIHWTNKIVSDQLGIKYFQGKSSKYGFIEISDIDRCVGFIAINNRTYIFDKENQVVCNQQNVSTFLNKNRYNLQNPILSLILRNPYQKTKNLKKDPKKENIHTLKPRT